MRTLMSSICGTFVLGLLAGCEMLNPSDTGASSTLPSPAAARPTAVAVSSISNATAVVKRTDLAAQIKVRGTVVSTNQFQLSFRQGGSIKKISVKAGDQVEEGAPLLELDDPALEDQLQSANFSLEGARNNLAQVQLPLLPGRSPAAAQALAAAQHAVATAQLKLQKLKTPPTVEDLVPYRAAVDKARTALTKAQDDYNKSAYLHGYEASPEARLLQSATLDYEVAQANLAQMTKGPRPEDVALAEADIQSTKANVQAAQANYDYEVQSEQTLAQQRNAAIESAQTTVRQLETRVATLQARLGEIKLVAPFAGSIVSLDAQVGDKVAPFQPLGVLADPKQLEVEAMVPEDSIPHAQLMQEAQVVQVVLDSFPNQKFKVKVGRTASKPVVWEGKQAYQIRLAFTDNSNVPATIGMGLDVLLAVNRPQVLTIPIAALLGNGSSRYVDVPSGTSTRKVSVVVGLTTDTEAEIKTGLREGDSVVVQPVK